MIIGVSIGALTPGRTGVMQLIVGEIAIGIIWGAIFGVIYPLFYDKIPGKGILKGLVYSLIIFVITHEMVALFYVLVGNYPEAVIA